MKYPEPIVGALIINRKNEILLIRQAKWNDQYCIPGGHVEFNESIEDAIKREVKEEVNLDVDVVELLGVQDNINSAHFHKKGVHFIFLDYLCRAITEEVKIDQREVQKFVWVVPEKALELPIHEGSRTTIEKFLAARDIPKHSPCSSDFVQRER